MPKFYFHMRENETRRDDPEGEELANLDAAVAEAILAAREIVAKKVEAGDYIGSEAFEITGEDGEVLKVLPLRSVLRLE